MPSKSSVWHSDMSIGPTDQFQASEQQFCPPSSFITVNLPARLESCVILANERNRLDIVDALSTTHEPATSFTAEEPSREFVKEAFPPESTGPVWIRETHLLLGVIYEHSKH